MAGSESGQYESGIHGQIARLARQMHGSMGESTFRDPASVLATATEAAVELLPGVDYAATTVVRRSTRGGRPAELQSTAATGDVPRLVDTFQHRFSEGPCLSAIWEHQTIRIRNVETETRWPTFVAAVRAQTPVRSTLSIQLYTTDRELGALNLYSRQVDSFDSAAEDLAVNLATHVAIALSDAHRTGAFRSALASRDIIGQAKGMCMERFDIDAVAAFELLRRLSQETNTPLALVAEQLVAKDHPVTGARPSLRISTSH